MVHTFNGSQATIKKRRPMSTMVTQQFKPSNDLMELLYTKGYAVEPWDFGVTAPQGTILGVHFTVTLQDGRKARFSAGRKDYDETVGYIAEVNDPDNDDFTGWDVFDAIGYDFNSALYSLVNQFEP